MLEFGFDGRGSGRLLSAPRRVYKRVDVRLSRHVHAYAANSMEVRDRIRHFWHRRRGGHPRPSTRIFRRRPRRQQSQSPTTSSGSAADRLQELDVMIEIAEQAGVPLILAGSGPDEAALRRQAAKVRVPCSVRGTADRARLRQLYWGGQGLASTRPRDFGIVSGGGAGLPTPVIGLDRAGYARRWLTEKQASSWLDSHPQITPLPWPGSTIFRRPHLAAGRRVQSSRVSIPEWSPGSHGSADSHRLRDQ